MVPEACHIYIYEAGTFTCNVTRPVVYNRHWAATFLNKENESFLLVNKRNPRFSNEEQESSSIR